MLRYSLFLVSLFEMDNSSLRDLYRSSNAAVTINWKNSAYFQRELRLVELVTVFQAGE